MDHAEKTPSASQAQPGPSAAGQSGAADCGAGKMTPQFELLSFLLGGRPAEQVVADVQAKQDESARNRAKGLVLMTECVRSPSGVVTGSVAPIWISPWERDRQAIDAAVDRLSPRKER